MYLRRFGSQLTKIAMLNVIFKKKKKVINDRDQVSKDMGHQECMNKIL